MMLGDVTFFDWTLEYLTTGGVSLAHKMLLVPITNRTRATVSDNRPVMANYERSADKADTDGDGVLSGAASTYLIADVLISGTVGVDYISQAMAPYVVFSTSDEITRLYSKLAKFPFRINSLEIWQILIVDDDLEDKPCVAFIDMTEDNGVTPWDGSTFRFQFGGSQVLLTGEVS